LDKVKEFSYNLNDFFVAFCSESCFQKSIYFKTKPSELKKREVVDEKKVEVGNKDSTNDFTCSKCWQEKTGEY